MNLREIKIPVLVLILIPALIIPLFVKGFILHILVLLLLWVVSAESLNFVTGFAGQLALGHAAFITIGGYVGSLLMLEKGMSFWPALAIGAGSAFITGALLGLIAMRMRGDYLGMVTMGFGEIVHLLALNLTNVTRGPMGLPGIPRPSIFGYTFTSEVPYYYLALIMVVLSHWSIERLVFSRFGRACRAMRDDETAAQTMGIRSYKYKVLAFCISSAYAGAVGTFYAAWITLFSPDSFLLIDSIMISAMITLGGIGSIYGPIPGGMGIGALPEILRPFTNAPRIASLRLAGVGAIMVIVLIFKPAGFFGSSTKRLFVTLDSVVDMFWEVWRNLRNRLKH